MSCNLPVITVRYGSLPALFEEGQGLFFASTADELMRGINSARHPNGCRTREKVTPYSWENIANYVLEQTMIEVKS
ncbi:MAG: hypothetical protein A2144_14870 [Chloroflexi bacterium RBG_16_50_9]|nr:MAG: hypothetical protein A2144_14870 [Chloroflexi bacterium RBG_16_50_9]